ncbi:MAG TPA: glycoside hydrolase family 3 N-terminal domain-containing protein [Ornithinicoccus sp.]|nr:glycoside hydrolase family 3 N-terminal domain-containing protein [Ornithinicoccus sp.]
MSPFRGAGLPSAAPRFLPRRGLTGLGPRRAAPRRLLIGATAAALLLAGCSGGGQLAEPTVGTTEVSSTSAGTRTGDQDGTMTSAPVLTSSPSASGEEPSSPAAPSGDAGIGLPSAQELDRARRDVSDLTDRQLVGQLVVAAYSGTDAQTGAALVRDHHLGGLITLGGNVPESVDARVPQLTALTTAVQEAVTADGRDWPAFLAIDQEGGPITRVSAPLDHWPAAMALGAADDPELVREVTRASGEQLRALGYTVVLAPVADVTIGPQDPTIGARSPGSDPQLVAETVLAQVTGFSEASILPVVKHFPGHGTLTADSHLGTALQAADRELLEERDLVPFRVAVDAGAPAIMPGHITVEVLDPGVPATFSDDVLGGLLRNEMGFTGVVVTDALNMGAVTDGTSGEHPAVAALLAGVDVLLMPPDPAGAIDAVVFALGDGTLTRERLEESAARTVAALRHQQAGESVPDLSVIGSEHELSVRAALAGITQLSGPCGGRLVGDSIRISGGSEVDRANLTTAARAAGLDTGSGDSVVLVGGTTYQAGGGPGGPGTGSGDVVVTTDRPYPLADSRATTALVAAFGRDSATMEALVQVLLGEAMAPGALPTSVGDYPVGSGCG